MGAPTPRRRTGLALLFCAAALLATAPRAQSTQTSQGSSSEAFDLEYLWALSYVSALDAYAYGNVRVLTQVIARGPYVPGRELDLTPALAVKLNISGATEVRWRFAR